MILPKPVRRLLWGVVLPVGVLVGAAALAHVVVGRMARLSPPNVSLPSAKVKTDPSGLRRLGDSYVFEHDGLIEARLVGSPEQIGYAHAKLLYRDMVQTEGVLYRELERVVESPLLRALIFDVAQFRFRHVHEGMSSERLREIAASAQALQPDPYEGVFPSYQRGVYLNALYDISLSFEHSPLVGCTSFVLSGAGAAPGHHLLARNFDFEVDEIFDRSKVVFLVREKGAIPFASVAWPGLVGVVSGMNAEGLAVVVHGARAGEPRGRGEAVVHALRRVLSACHDVEEALSALRQREPMVSHVVVALDAAGEAAVAERVPGETLYHYAVGPKAAITNHLVGPSADDPKNVRVKATTSTLHRWRRGQQLLGRMKRPATAVDAVGLLRDRLGINDAKLPLGDRRAIDALIATHGVIMDTSERTMWVSSGPHLLGRFVAFDLNLLLAPGYEPSATSSLPRVLAQDPLLTSGQYDRWRRLTAAAAPN
jgi:hypothetical protein